MTPSTLLWATFAVLSVAIFILMWGGGVFIQSFLYSVVANRLVVRAAVAGVVVGGFLTFWTYVNTRADSKDRYGNVFEFNPTSIHPFDQFEAVRKSATGAETQKAFTRVGTRFVEDSSTDKAFSLSTSDYMVSAILVKDAEGKPIRYAADLDANGKYKGGSNRVFTEAGGRRYIEFGQTNTPTPVYAPSRAAFFGAVALNMLIFVVWWFALWLILGYEFWHAVGGAFMLGLPMMLLLMPLLFDKNQIAAPAPKPAAAS